MITLTKSILTTHRQSITGSRRTDVCWSAGSEVGKSWRMNGTAWGNSARAALKEKLEEHLRLSDWN